MLNRRITAGSIGDLQRIEEVKGSRVRVKGNKNPAKGQGLTVQGSANEFFYSYPVPCTLCLTPGIYILPRNELVQLGKHLVNFNPVLEIFGGADVLALVYHDPAHMGGAVFTGRAVSGF